MAEAMINHCLGDAWTAFSAGTEPSQVNPRALLVLQEIGVPVDQLRSKSVSEFLTRTDLDLIVTVCDHAREACPVFPATIPQTHIAIEDPAPWTHEPEEQALPVFRRVREQIRRQILMHLQAHRSM